jgi:hypothetical protein
MDEIIMVFTSVIICHLTLMAFGCGERSAFQPEGIRLLEKHALAPSAAGFVRLRRWNASAIWNWSSRLSANQVD